MFLTDFFRYYGYFCKICNYKDLLMIRFGIIGTGRISDWVLAGAVQDPRIKIAAVCSRTAQKASEFISRHPEAAGAKIYTEVETMVADQEIDAIYIGTPNQTHHSYAITCLNAGKHVLCEKPLAVCADEAREMAESARKNGCLLMEAMISTLNPNFRAAVEKIEDIRPVRQYSSYFCQYSSKYEALKKGIMASAFQPGTAGALRDVGIYTLYPLVSIFGKPAEIKSESMFFKTPEGAVDIHGSMILRYEGMDATLTYSKICDSFIPTEISGEKGNLILDAVHIARRTEHIPHAAPTSGQGPRPGGSVISEGLEHNEYYYEFKEFADVLESGRIESDINSLKTSIAVMEIIDEALAQNK